MDGKGKKAIRRATDGIVNLHLDGHVRGYALVLLRNDGDTTSVVSIIGARDTVPLLGGVTSMASDLVHELRVILNREIAGG